MRRLLLCVFALTGGFALSCQVFPGGQPPNAATDTAVLPSVAAAGETTRLASPDLATRIAVIEGSAAPATDAREAEIARVISIFEGRHSGLSKREIAEVARTIVDECEAHDLEVGLVMAVIQVESAGYHRAVSPVGALGLMQLMPPTGAEMARERGVDWYGPETLFDPVVNVRLGIAYLRELTDRYDHVPTALAAYNWGPGRIDRRIRRGAKMPRLYIEQVMRAYDQAPSVPTGRI
jgi:soluble lytic murein transglycosylase-like protein